MNFTVVWTRRALNQLADIWSNAADRGVVTAAADRMDAALSADPANTGESRGGADRIVLDWPLSILFHVDQTRRIVHVTSVGVSGRQP